MGVRGKIIVVNGKAKTADKASFNRTMEEQRRSMLALSEQLRRWEMKYEIHQAAAVDANRDDVSAKAEAIAASLDVIKKQIEKITTAIRVVDMSIDKLSAVYQSRPVGSFGSSY